MRRVERANPLRRERANPLRRAPLIVRQRMPLAEEHPRTYGNGWLFGFGSKQAYSDATQVIAAAEAGGIGLPDRDYYVNTTARSKDLRKKDVAHIAKMLELVGEGLLSLLLAGTTSANSSSVA